ncbi:hypothetical protein MQX02_18200, partial [Acinetobacter baumannii]|nr:hypothetical protein [Acinetobacter baumannii]
FHFRYLFKMRYSSLKCAIIFVVRKQVLCHYFNELYFFVVYKDENQIKASEQALIDFPELRTNILKRKNQLLQDIEKLKAYTDFLTSLI